MDWLNSLETVARAAGSVAMRYFRQGLSVETKADGSPVTRADRETEEAVRSWINTRFPDDAILGEEGGFSGPPNAEHRWVIDPIDGTKSFIRGVPLWGTMIAVMAADTVLAGAVFCPALDEMIIAAQGDGCWHNGSRCHVSSVNELSAATILTTSVSFARHAEREKRWQSLVSRAAIARTWGDCYGYVLLATGRADVMLDNRLSLWDYAPLVPIVREAGGVITGWRGTADFEGDAIATNAMLAECVRGLLVDAAARQPPAKSAP